MTTTKNWLAGLGLALALASVPALAIADSIQGLIVNNDGHTIVVRGGGTDTPVMLTDSTKIEQVSGRLGLQRQDSPASNLIAGLAVSVDTVQNGAELDAAKISFKAGDLKTAMSAQAAMAPEKQKLAAARQKLIAAQAENERRLSEVGQYAEKGRTRVYFANGSAVINAAGKQSLRSIASQAQAYPSAMLRVVGFTDSTGSAAANQRLSDQRASAVTAYLVQHVGVSPEKMMAPSGMGQNLPSDTDTSGPSAQNRRVTVFILVSKASMGTSSLPPSGSNSPSAPMPQ